MAEFDNAPSTESLDAGLNATVAPVPKPSDDAEFDSIFEQAAPKIAEMARRARALRQAGETRKFPA